MNEQQQPIACPNRPAPPPGYPAGPCEPGIRGRPNDCVWCHRTLPDCSAPGAAGPCMPRNADGRCIWCERELAPGWPGIGRQRQRPCPARSAYPGAPCLEAIGSPRTCLHCHAPMPFSIADDLHAAMIAAPPTDLELDQWFRDAGEWANEKHTGSLGEAWTSARRTYSLIAEVRKLRAYASLKTKLDALPTQREPTGFVFEVPIHGDTRRTAAGELLPLTSSFIDVARAAAEAGDHIHPATALILLDEIDRLKVAFSTRRPRIALPQHDWHPHLQSLAGAYPLHPPDRRCSWKACKICNPTPTAPMTTDERETPLLRQRSQPPHYWTNERAPTTAELERWKTIAVEHLERSPFPPDSAARETIERLAGYALSATLEVLRLRAMVRQMVERDETGAGGAGAHQTGAQLTDGEVTAGCGGGAGAP